MITYYLTQSEQCHLQNFIWILFITKRSFFFEIDNNMGIVIGCRRGEWFDSGNRRVTASLLRTTGQLVLDVNSTSLEASFPVSWAPTSASRRFCDAAKRKLPDCPRRYAWLVLVSFYLCLSTSRLRNAWHGTACLFPSIHPHQLHSLCSYTHMFDCLHKISINKFIYRAIKSTKLHTAIDFF